MPIAPASVELSPSPEPVGSFTHHTQTQHSSIYINMLFFLKNTISKWVSELELISSCESLRDNTQFSDTSEAAQRTLPAPVRRQAICA